MIADLRRSAASTEVLLALVMTFNLAVIAVLSDWTLVGIIVGGVVGLALVSLMVRWAWLIPVTVVVGFALQPALKFYLSDAFGPAKDAAVVVAVAALLASLLRRRWGLDVATGPRRSVDRALVLGVLAFITLYVINPAGDHGTGWATGARLVVEAFALFLVGYLGTTPARTWRWVVTAALVVAVIETLAGIAEQYIGVTRLVQDLGYTYGEQVRQISGGALRSFGTLDEPFSYAALVLLGFIVALHAPLPRALRIPLSLFIAAGVVVSFDRTDIVLLVLAAALWLVRRGLHRPAVGVLVATVLLAAAYVTTNQLEPAAQGTSAASTVLSLNGRFAEWGTVLADPGNLLGGAGVGVTGAGAVRGQGSGIVAVGRFQSNQPNPPAVASNVLPSLELELPGDALRRRADRAPAVPLHRDPHDHDRVRGGAHGIERRLDGPRRRGPAPP